MTTLLQVLVTGLGLGAAYTLFAQGIVLIYRGSGIVNFAQGALGMVAAYTTFLTFRERWGYSIVVSIVLGILASVVVALGFHFLVLRQLAKAAPITRLISTLGLLVVLQSGVQLGYGTEGRPVFPYLPHDTFDWGGVRVQEQVLYIIGITLAVTLGLWLFGKYSRFGLAMTAASENERAVQTMGWSPNRLGSVTWAIGAALAGLAAVLLAPLTSLSPITFTLIVTVTAMAAALLGGFRSFPLTLVGGLIVGIGESAVTRYRFDIQDFLGGTINGLERAIPFLFILLILVVRGRGLPLRSHVTDRLPSLGSGHIHVRALLLAAGVLLVLLFGPMNNQWAAATFTSLASGVIVLSIVVLTGYAGQLSLAQWALAGAGALIAGSFVYRLDFPPELAMPLGVLLTIPVGMLFALPALRTRGVNLAIVTLGLGFTIQAVVFTNGEWIGNPLDLTGGTRIGPTKIFGIAVDGATHPHTWAVVCLIAFVATALVVANLRRSRTGMRLIAVRTNERAAASLGISVFGVKVYAFGVAAGIAGLGGILFGFRGSVITYEQFNPFQSIFSVGWAVIGGLGWVVGAALSAPNAIGGIGTRFMEDALSIARFDALVGGVIVLLIIVFNQNGLAEVASRAVRPVALKLRLISEQPTRERLARPTAESVAPITLSVKDLTVQFGGVTAVDRVSLIVHPGEVVGLIGPNGAGKTTIIDAVTGYVKPVGGEVALDDVGINSWSATKRARQGLRRSFQSLELFEDISVEDNIRVGADARDPKSWLTDLLWPGRHSLPSTAVSAIHEFDLEPFLGALPDQLPYGRRRLVGIARAVASGPSVVMLDEPAAGLDDTESRELASLIRRLANDWKMGVLLVEHDVGLVMSTCDRIVVVDFGRVIATGTPSQVRDDDAVKRAYLGNIGEEDGSTDADAASKPENAAPAP